MRPQLGKATTADGLGGSGYQTTAAASNIPDWDGLDGSGRLTTPKNKAHKLRRTMALESMLQIDRLFLPFAYALADKYLEYFDGMSIGSNDMTQLTLGLDRDSALVADAFDERDEAVLAMLAMTIRACKKNGKYVGICGQGPSDHPDLARWLLDEGIESMSLNPDSVVETWMFLAGETV